MSLQNDQSISDLSAIPIADRSGYNMVIKEEEEPVTNKNRGKRSVDSDDSSLRLDDDNDDDGEQNYITDEGEDAKERKVSSRQIGDREILANVETLDE